VNVRVLGPGDAAALEAFLGRHADSSMFLRSNARRAGLEDHGRPYEATYVAAEDGGAIVAVAAHCWNGMLLLQAPSHAAAVARAAAARSTRRLRGFAGPWEQVTAARAALGAAAVPTAKPENEGLYALSLAALRVPAPLGDGRWTWRVPTAADDDLLFGWRLAFNREALGLGDTPAVRDETGADVRRWREEGSGFVLEDAGRPVAFAAWNAWLPDIVQIGGVWTPPALRGRGYGRGATAAALLAARARGATRGVLFTDAPAAVTAYTALGFERVGTYGLVLLAD
jgi:GNAT superfamily N-acetyltransferase